MPDESDLPRAQASPSHRKKASQIKLEAQKAQKKITQEVNRQHTHFIEAARDLGCDEDESAFDNIVKTVAKAPPPRQEEKPKRKPTK